MKTYRLFAIIVAALLAGACSEKTNFANLSTLNGEWYNYREDEQNMVDSYVEFSRGYFITYKADRMLAASEGKVYGCSKDDFSVAFMEPYSILDGCLISGRHNFGQLSIDGDILRIGKLSYRRMTAMTPECYSSIELEENRITQPPVGQTLKRNVKVINPVKGYENVSVTKCPEWVIGLKVSEGKIEFMVGAGFLETAVSDSIVFSNPFSKDAKLYIDGAGPDVIGLDGTTRGKIKAFKTL